MIIKAKKTKKEIFMKRKMNMGKGSIFKLNKIIKFLITKYVNKHTSNMK